MWHSFSLKVLVHSMKNKRQRKNDYSVIEQNALSSNYMENILKGLLPKMTGQNNWQDESLTGQVHDQAGHCPLTGRFFFFFSPGSSRARWPVATNFCSWATRKSLLFLYKSYAGHTGFHKFRAWAPFNFSQSTALDKAFLFKPWNENDNCP